VQGSVVALLRSGGGPETDPASLNLLLFRLGDVVGSGVVTRKTRIVRKTRMMSKTRIMSKDVENADDVSDANGIDLGVPREKQSRWKATASGEEEE
jgi:hypothetical protein